jgi:nicotinate-nucleotide pyrophosphorylase (carboxylating)
MELEASKIHQAVKAALAEDVGGGDATTISVIPSDARAKASVVAREAMILCGMAFMREAFLQVDPTIQFLYQSRESQSLEPGDIVATLEGPAQGILTAERTALNYLQRLSGIATLTRKHVDAIGDLPCRVLDTRKTTPGWRLFEKYAVACGGGKNHRMGLHDMVMIKDNHLAALGVVESEAIALAVQKARQAFPGLKIEVEADRLEQARWAMEAGADYILLDNMQPESLVQAVELNRGRCLLEASGGIGLDTIHAIATTGVDFVSIGALTHSARSVDIALDFATIQPA